MTRALHQLPAELLLLIAQYLTSQRDINALVQTSKSLYHCLHFFLCQHNVHHGQGSALLWAAQNGYTELASKLLDAGLEIASFERPTEVAYDKNTTVDLSAVNPLLACAQSGHIETLKLMLSEKRSNQRCSSAQLRTVLHWAISSHQEQLMELMIEHKAPMNPAGDHGGDLSALGVAVSSGYVSIVSRLLELGAQPGDEECPGPVEQAICTHQPLLVELLLKNHVRMSCDKGVCYLASRGNKALLQLLIENGTDMSVYGGAALLYAIREGHYDTTKLLLDNGANPNLKCDLREWSKDLFFCYSCIGFAIHFGRVDVLKLLLKKGVLPRKDDLEYLERYPKEIVDLLPKIPKNELPSKVSLFQIANFGFWWLYDGSQKGQDFKMPSLTDYIDEVLLIETSKKPDPNPCLILETV